MKTKQFDCVELKNQIQEDLFNKIKPKNAKDYITKLKELSHKSSFIQEIMETYAKRSVLKS